MTAKPYRILITGSRDWRDDRAVRRALLLAVGAVGLDRDVVIVHGACPTGVDHVADTWARRWAVDVEAHPAQGHPTEDFGPWPGAGPRRNAHMVGLGADECLAFIGPCTRPNCRRPQSHGSHGATDCADRAERAGIPVRRWTAAPIPSTHPTRKD